MKNQIIIQEVNFDLINFNGTGKDYRVQAYAVNPTESDDYTVTIDGINNTTEIEYHADSSGGMIDDNITDCDLSLFVHKPYSLKENMV